MNIKYLIILIFIISSQNIFAQSDTIVLKTINNSPEVELSIIKPWSVNINALKYDILKYEIQKENAKEIYIRIYSKHVIKRIRYTHERKKIMEGIEGLNNIMGNGLVHFDTVILPLKIKSKVKVINILYNNLEYKFVRLDSKLDSSKLFELNRIYIHKSRELIYKNNKIINNGKKGEEIEINKRTWTTDFQKILNGKKPKWAIDNITHEFIFDTIESNVQ